MLNNRHPVAWLCTSVLLLLSACDAEPVQHRQIPVHAIEIQPQTVPVTLEAPGQIAGSAEVEVRSRVNGVLQKKNYIEGSFVKQGAVLFTLETDSAQQAYNAAKANVAVQKALLDQASANNKRVISLVQQNALSRRDGEDANAAYSTAKASYEAVRAQAANTKLSVDYGVIRAPISGYTSSEVRSVGSLVSPQDVLTKISVINPIYVNFSFSESELARLNTAKRSGEVTAPSNGGSYEVAITLDNGNEYPIFGQVNFTDKTVSKTTGTIAARAVFNNPQADLLPGLFVKVALRGAVRHGAILVPQRSVASSIQGKSVWILTPENGFELRNVLTDVTIGQSIVITEGLQAGDRIIVDNLIKLPQMPPKTIVAPIMLTLDEFYQSLITPIKTAPTDTPEKTEE